MEQMTPGPWEIGYGGQEGDDYAVITSPHATRAICNLEPGDYRPENARLIATAPDLLETLQWIADHGDTTDGWRPAFHAMRSAARAAIAKATK